MAETKEPDEMKTIIEMMPGVKPQTEESKADVATGVTGIVNDLVPSDVQRRSVTTNVEPRGQIRRRRSAGEESNDEKEHEESVRMTNDQVCLVDCDFEMEVEKGTPVFRRF